MWISKRSDIKPQGVHSPNGWQAVDATPQELSDDQNQMGPASVAFVSKSIHERCYDTQFVKSEVNADIKIYLFQGNTEKEALEHPKYVDAKGDRSYYKGLKYLDDPHGDTFNTVGCLIYTKKIGPISKTCSTNSAKCKKDIDDITWKKKQPYLHGGYKTKKLAPGIPTEDTDTATCTYGSQREEADHSDRAMEPDRFVSIQALLRGKNSKGNKRTLSERLQEEEDGNEIEYDEPLPKRRAETDDAMAVDEKEVTSNNIEISFNAKIRAPVIIGQEHKLSVQVTNNNEDDIDVVVSFSGIALDYRGVPLIRHELRTKKVPWRIVMQGRQTIARVSKTIASGATEDIGLVVPSIRAGSISGGSNKFIRWTVSTNVKGSTATDGALPHEFSARLV